MMNNDPLYRRLPAARALLASMLLIAAACSASEAGPAGAANGTSGDAMPDDVSDASWPQSDSAVDTSWPEVESGIDGDIPADVEQDQSVPDASAGCSCTPGECGLFERCGAIVDCGVCPGTGESCIKSASPRFQNKVRAGIAQVEAEHPEYFDFTEPMGESVRIVDGAAYHTALAAAVSAQGLVCIVDPNFDHDIRIRHPSVQPDQAENYLIHTSWDYTAYKYTSTCAPAGF